MADDFLARYPHGVLVEQEGGVPNDAVNWDTATHVCRKHRVRERVCVDAEPEPEPVVDMGYWSLAPGLLVQLGEAFPPPVPSPETDTLEDRHEQ